MLTQKNWTALSVEFDKVGGLDRDQKGVQTAKDGNYLK
jgi:hypothetical protein